MSPETAVVESVRRRPSFHNLLSRPATGAAFGAIFAFVFFSITGARGGFLSWAGLASWLAVAAELGLIAIPVGLMIIAGEFDLSIGSVLAAGSMITVVLTEKSKLPSGVAVLAALLFGAAIGVVNGTLVNRTKVPSFIVTLVTLFVVSGFGLWAARRIAGTTAVSHQFTGATHKVFAGEWHQFKVSLLWWLALAVAAGWMLRRSPFGNWVLATGGDEETARQNGVPVGRVKLAIYVMTGVCAALVGVIQAVEFNNADVTRGQSFVFQCVIAAVIGGCLLSGGYGSVLGVVLGTATYAIVSIGVFYTGWNPDLVQLFVGLLLLFAVLGNNVVRRRALTP
jgi:simple sugar transport system permease protein